MIKEVWAKVSYWWFIVMLAIVGFFCGAFNVDALTTITPSTYGHKVEFSTGRCSFGTFPNCDYIVEGTTQSGWLTGDYTNFCPSGKTCTFLTDWYYVKLPSSLNPGTTYAWNFDTWITTRANQSYYNSNVDYWLTASNTGSYDQTSSANVSNLSCRAGLTEGTTTRVSWSCSFTPTKQINYLYLRMSFNSAKTTFTSYGCNKGSLTYDNAQVDAINNQTQIIKDQTTIINNNLNDLNDNITSDDIDDPDSFINTIKNSVATNGTITQLITLPITLYQKVLDSINGTCSQFNLGSLYGTNLIMPCIDLDEYLGSTLWSTIDIICSGVFVLTIARKMIKAFNNFTSLKEGDVIND